MADVVYRIVEHDGGWAYKLGDVFSETFANRASAETAARAVASQQRVPGEDEQISWEDEIGDWHTESQSGSDRPATFVMEPSSRERFTPSGGANAGKRRAGDGETAAEDEEGDLYLRSVAQSAGDWVKISPTSSLLLAGACSYVIAVIFARPRAKTYRAQS